MAYFLRLIMPSQILDGLYSLIIFVVNQNMHPTVTIALIHNLYAMLPRAILTEINKGCQLGNIPLIRW